MPRFLDDVFGSKTFDYGVETLTNTTRSAGGFHTTVVARRFGDATFPIEVETRFEDGSTRTERWDGVARRVTYEYDGRSRATSAQTDPRRVLMLDTHLTNNSVSLRPSTDAASTKWSLTWMAWLQDVLLTFASLA